MPDGLSGGRSAGARARPIFVGGRRRTVYPHDREGKRFWSGWVGWGRSPRCAVTGPHSALRKGAARGGRRNTPKPFGFTTVRVNGFGRNGRGGPKSALRGDGAAFCAEKRRRTRWPWEYPKTVWVHDRECKRFWRGWAGRDRSPRCPVMGPHSALVKGAARDGRRNSPKPFGFTTVRVNGFGRNGRGGPKSALRGDGAAFCAEKRRRTRWPWEYPKTVWVHDREGKRFWSGWAGWGPKAALPDDGAAFRAAKRRRTRWPWEYPKTV